MMTRQSNLALRPVRLLHWRFLLSLFFCLTLALAPSLAEARAGGGKSSFGTRGARTFEQKSAAPIRRRANTAEREPRREPDAAGDAAVFRRDASRGGSRRQLLSASSLPDRTDRRGGRGRFCPASRRRGPLFWRDPGM